MKAILSIKPQFVEKILSGEKKFEYRKKIFKKHVNTVIIYSSSPVCRLVGEFTVTDILCDDTKEIWENTKVYSGISYEYFKKYFLGHDLAYALKINDLKIYDTPIVPDSLIPNFNPPQSYCYIKEDKE